MAETTQTESNAMQAYKRNLQRYALNKKLDASYLSRPLVSPDEPLHSAYLRAISEPNPLVSLDSLMNYLKLQPETEETKDLMILCNRAVFTIFVQQNEYRAAMQQLQRQEQLNYPVDEELKKLLQVMGYIGGLTEEYGKPENEQVREIYEGNGMQLLRFVDTPQIDKADYFSQE